MKKINRRILNTACWLEVILSYLLPFHVTERSVYQTGFPVPFLSVHAGTPHGNPLMSMHLNPVPLLSDIFILYMIISVCIIVYRKIGQCLPQAGS